VCHCYKLATPQELKVATSSLELHSMAMKAFEEDKPHDKAGAIMLSSAQTPLLLHLYTAVPFLVACLSIRRREHGRMPLILKDKVKNKALAWHSHATLANKGRGQRR
jgi:hypothetical protein